MPLLAADNAICACDKGSQPSPLGVIATKPIIKAVKELAADIEDCKPNFNVRPFGMCSSMGNPAVKTATAENEGVLTPVPCLPVIPVPWAPGDPTVLINGKPALTVSSMCQCTWGGTITIGTPAAKTMV